MDAKGIGLMVLQWAVSAGAVALVVSLWHRLMQYMRELIEEKKLVKNVKVEALLDSLALRAVDYVEKVGARFIKERAAKLRSDEKLAMAKSMVKDAAARHGVIVGDADAEVLVENAHSAMERAVGFPVPVASSTSDSGERPKEG